MIAAEVRPEYSENEMENCSQKNGERSLFFRKKHNLLNPRRLGAIPGCSPWTRPLICNHAQKVFLLVNDLPVIIQWCLILREENEAAVEEEERRRWRVWQISIYLSIYRIDYLKYCVWSIDSRQLFEDQKLTYNSNAHCQPCWEIVLRTFMFVFSLMFSRIEC